MVHAVDLVEMAPGGAGVGQSRGRVVLGKGEPGAGVPDESGIHRSCGTGVNMVGLTERLVGGGTVAAFEVHHSEQRVDPSVRGSPAGGVSGLGRFEVGERGGQRTLLEAGQRPVVAGAGLSKQVAPLTGGGERGVGGRVGGSELACDDQGMNHEPDQSRGAVRAEQGVVGQRAGGHVADSGRRVACQRKPERDMRKQGGPARRSPLPCGPQHGEHPPVGVGHQGRVEHRDREIAGQQVFPGRVVRVEQVEGFPAGRRGPCGVAPRVADLGQHAQGVRAGPGRRVAEQREPLRQRRVRGRVAAGQLGAGQLDQQGAALVWRSRFGKGAVEEPRRRRGITPRQRRACRLAQHPDDGGVALGRGHEKMAGHPLRSFTLGGEDVGGTPVRTGTGERRLVGVHRGPDERVDKRQRVPGPQQVRRGERVGCPFGGHQVQSGVGCDTAQRGAVAEHRGRGGQPAGVGR